MHAGVQMEQSSAEQAWLGVGDKLFDSVPVFVLRIQ